MKYRSIYRYLVLRQEYFIIYHLCFRETSNTPKTDEAPGGMDGSLGEPMVLIIIKFVALTVEADVKLYLCDIKLITNQQMPLH